MSHLAINVLWLTSLILPALLFLTKNNFKSRIVTTLRALLSIAGGWLFMFAYAIAAQSLSADLSEPVSGAALVFAATFGWILSAVIVAVCWLIAYFVRIHLAHND
jgi:hypothetical protein